MAVAGVERLIAWRYLRARREEGFISVIAGFSLVGITLGVGTLIVVMAVMNGFRLEMLRQMSSLGGQVGVQGGREGLSPTPDLMASLLAIPGVVSASPTVEGQLMAVAGDRVRGVVLRGMRPEDLQARTAIAASIDGAPALRDRYRAQCRDADDKPIDWGSLKSFGDDFSVVVGRRFAELMGLKVGDTLQLVSPASIATPLGVMPRSAAARVAVFCAGMYDYDLELRLRTAGRRPAPMGTGDKVTGIEVYLADGISIESVRSRIIQTVGLSGLGVRLAAGHYGFSAAVRPDQRCSWSSR
ncbi:MAG: ABC transporter permease [Reyranellaceae bacterium]